VTAPSGGRRHVPPRQLLARHLLGTGIEVGPGQHPFELPLPGVDVRYVDRWDPHQSGELFPRHAAQGEFAAPDILADFNTDRLGAVGDDTQDFVIASHVLEHLADPIGFLAEMHRVLRPGGVALVLLPDRHRTADRNRSATALSHLVAEHEAGVDEVSEEHVVEWLESRGLSLGDTPEDRVATLDRHRRRSIHVHCWDAPEFLDVVLWSIEHLDQHWEFVDGSLPMDEFPPGIEFGFVLRRSTVPLDPDTGRRRFDAAWRAWNDARTTPKLAPVEHSLVQAHRRARQKLWPTVLRYRRLRRRLSGRRAPAAAPTPDHDD